MKKENISDALNDIDFDMVEDAYESRKSKPATWRRWVALAACLALVLGAAIAVPILKNAGSSQYDWAIPSDIPVWDAAQYSAEEIASLFGSVVYDGTGVTNAYTKIYTSHSQYLNIKPLTTDEYLPVYQRDTEGKKLNETELRSFIDGILPRLTTALGIEPPQYTVNSYKGGTLAPHLSAGLRTEPYYISADQNSSQNDIVVFSNANDGQIVIAGKPVQIDQTLSDEEILTSLQPVKEKLFEIFGASFSDAKVIRDFGAYKLHGAEFIDIYFYDADAHYLNGTQDVPVSDYIRLSFDNYQNSETEVESDDIIKSVRIRYVKNRADVKDAYAPLAAAKRISLEAAEALLYEGYVFGNPVCSLCMAMQSSISFKDYDFVEIEYIFDRSKEDTGLGIPFYAFYQFTGVAPNGNRTYAKTYVAAIAVSGYEEYHQSHAE